MKTQTTPNREDLQIATDLILEGKAREGMQRLKSIIVNTPDSEIADDAYYLLGLAFLKFDAKAKAATCFERILKHYPDSSLYRYASLQQEKIQAELDPAHELYVEGEGLFREKKLKKALDIFQKIIKEYPQSVLTDNALLYIGLLFRSLEKSGYDQEASKAFARLLKDYPDSDAADFLREQQELMEMAKSHS